MEHGTSGRIDLAITTQIEVVVRKIQIGTEKVKWDVRKDKREGASTGELTPGRDLSITV